MAGNLKEVRLRIKSVQSTQQITKAMKMVSAAKLRRAQDAILQVRPYTQKLQELLNEILIELNEDASIALAEHRHIDKVLLIVITSDRGLAGAYNTNVVKTAKHLLETKYSTQLKKKAVEVWNIGKKGYEMMTKMGYRTNPKYKDIFLNLSFEQVYNVAQAAISGFERKEFDAIEIVYSQFKNASTQAFVSEHFLPIEKVEKIEGKKVKEEDFLLEPSIDTLLTSLVPNILNAQLFKAVLDAHASEHGARMTAMDKASENANELIKSLKISYNTARQAAITTELTEIVSGAAALQG